jgi:TetR/AcrR family transcriptional repressor of nem operon
MKTSRDQLLELGEKIVVRDGFGAFSFGVLATAASIRKASVHHHFPSKADFALALAVRHLDRLQAARADAESDPRRGSAALRGFLKERREQIADGRGMDLAAAFACGALPAGEELETALVACREAVHGRLRAILQAGRRDRSIAVGGDLDDEARAILAQVDGAELAARLAGDPNEFDRALATLAGRLSSH